MDILPMWLIHMIASGWLLGWLLPALCVVLRVRKELDPIPWQQPVLVAPFVLALLSIFVWFMMVGPLGFTGYLSKQLLFGLMGAVPARYAIIEPEVTPAYFLFTSGLFFLGVTFYLVVHQVFHLPFYGF